MHLIKNMEKSLLISIRNFKRKILEILILLLVEIKNI